MDGRAARIDSAIAALNALEVGELSQIDARLRLVSADLAGLGEGELEAVVQSARQALGRADLANFRRLVAQATARLGHLR